ncbi:hypothetical protein LX64_01416 [Chitinophaga skermanii]|uniref:Natural product n=1 Tax=Chitinophaga skermanii TaxID=331697 RepID=A0A327QYR3_9BACT|nr:class I lanthipeptide [Chitinophaga skermanii]RAJ08762.1 hypothetical protein LX64_01416 [Chitinophaga skermanii]
MKKKKVTLAKLNFDKSVVAVLNVTELQQVKGGIDTINGTRCATRVETCNTFPYTEEACVFC